MPPAELENVLTNRWLLERAGSLAATSMLVWLNQSDTPDEERTRAYGLFPDSKAAKKRKEQVEASEQDAAQEEMSTEAVAMAYLMRGVHF